MTIVYLTGHHQCLKLRVRRVRWMTTPGQSRSLVGHEKWSGVDRVEPETPLISTKMRQPRLRQGIVRRARLFEPLDAEPKVSLILLSAPAGYGKSTVMSAWARACGDAGTVYRATIDMPGIL